MNGETIVVGLAAVMGGTTAFMLVIGVVVSPIFLVFALPFAGATYVMWRHATGRLDFERVRTVASAGAPPGGAGPHFGDGSGADRKRRARRNRRRAHRARRAQADERRRRTGNGARSDGASLLSKREAENTLGVEPDAPQSTVKRAYRRRVKEVHPDTDTGSREEFKRVTRAYERLREE